MGQRSENGRGTARHAPPRSHHGSTRIAPAATNDVTTHSRPGSTERRSRRGQTQRGERHSSRELRIRATSPCCPSPCTEERGLVTAATAYRQRTMETMSASQGGQPRAQRPEAPRSASDRDGPSGRAAPRILRSAPPHATRRAQPTARTSVRRFERVSALGCGGHLGPRREEPQTNECPQQKPAKPRH